MATWDHVDAPVSRAILESETLPTTQQLCQAHTEMAQAFEQDEKDATIDPKAFEVRERALEALGLVLGENNDVFDDKGEFIGNPGIDKDTAVKAIQAFWSDGEEHPVPSVSHLEFEHVESGTIRALLKNEITPTQDLAYLARDYAALQNEYSERNDGEDFAVDRWENMQTALRAADAAQTPEEIIEHLRTYYRLWQRFSTIY